MLAIITLLLPFFGLILIGYVAARAVKQPADALGYMNVFIVYAALPALFFKLVAATPFHDLTRIDFIASDIGGTYLLFALLFGIGTVLRRATLGDSTIQAFGGSYGNIGYMGPGLALIAFGEAAAVPVALIVCLENAIHFIVAPAMMALAGGDRRSRGEVALGVLRSVSLHPFILSTVAGFLVAGFEWQLPAAFSRLVDMLAQAAAPCALFAMGATLALRPIRRVPVEIGYLAAAKLIVHPLLIYMVLTAVGGFEPTWVHAAMLLAALPTATNVFVISQHYGVWQERASATILITTLLSVVTLPFFLYLIELGFFPVP